MREKIARFLENTIFFRKTGVFKESAHLKKENTRFLNKQLKSNRAEIRCFYKKKLCFLKNHRVFFVSRVDETLIHKMN